MNLKSSKCKRRHGQSWYTVVLESLLLCHSLCILFSSYPHLRFFLWFLVVFPLLLNQYREGKGVSHSTLTTIKTPEVYTSDILGSTYLISLRDGGITWSISLYIPERPMVEKNWPFCLISQVQVCKSQTMSNFSTFLERAGDWLSNFLFSHLLHGGIRVKLREISTIIIL